MADHRFTTIGLSDVREQPFDLPPQWMPQSWSVKASAAAPPLPLSSAQPTYRGVATPAGGLDLEACDVGFATDADLASRTSREGGVLLQRRLPVAAQHISKGAVKRIGEKGAAAIFITLLIPGNLRFQFYPVGARCRPSRSASRTGCAVRT